ncbi:transglutaminase domain-containing protein [Luteirhabdus pelagi]|uniref:transglutaminase domain-containing protein n=1 Tax=Luteirhabdus pelagi TaxID=2792783 RepID=UPI00193A66B2|nr:transglutaminase domain-containing protein [Luteirhabdus pelagi]
MRISKPSLRSLPAVRHGKYLGAMLMFFFFLLTTPFVQAQDFERVDAAIQLYPEKFENAEEFSRLIGRDFETDADKVRAMYSWMVRNIAYDPDEYKKFNYNFKSYRERNEKEQATRKKIIARTLQEGVAVCEGYAMVFERLCELQGIPNYLVRGDTKASFNDIGRPFKNNHMWNVATIDGQPYLFDVTWGAGKYNGRFIRDISYFWFQTPPELFFNSHYPAQYEDAFLSEAVSREEFSNRPLIMHNSIRLENIEKPSSGIISDEASSGLIKFHIKMKPPKTIIYSYGNQKKEVSTIRMKSDEIFFEVPLELGAEWLLLYFDEKPVLGYLLK